MGQRINIQYSIDEDRFETEMGRILKNALEGLQQTSELLRAALDASTRHGSLVSSDTIQNISLARQKLSDADFGLGDVSGMMSGFVTYQLEAQAHAPEVPPEPSEQYDIPPDSHPMVDALNSHQQEHAFSPDLSGFSSGRSGEMKDNIEAVNQLIEKITTLDEDSLLKFKGFSIEELEQHVLNIKEETTDSNGA
tara:strand:- start:1369 stop:1950 length:582 start_codon:yes stop_codon:yes gene_type:complete